MPRNFLREIPEITLRIAFEMKLRDLLLYTVLHQFFSWTVNLFQLIVPFLTFAFAEKGEDVVTTSLLALTLYIGSWIFQIIFLVIYIVSGNNRTLLTEKVVELQDEGLFEETRFNRSFHYWPGILKAVRRPGFTAIYTSAMAAHVIPDRAFLNEYERENFWSAVKLRLKDCAAA